MLENKIVFYKSLGPRHQPPSSRSLDAIRSRLAILYSTAHPQNWSVVQWRFTRLNSQGHEYKFVWMYLNFVSIARHFDRSYDVFQPGQFVRDLISNELYMSNSTRFLREEPRNWQKYWSFYVFARTVLLGREQPMCMASVKGAIYKRHKNKSTFVGATR